ncbi:unnamed protein product [Ectocarpus sp. 13 AM-2016]
MGQVEELRASTRARATCCRRGPGMKKVGLQRATAYSRQRHAVYSPSYLTRNTNRGCRPWALLDSLTYLENVCTRLRTNRISSTVITTPAWHGTERQENESTIGTGMGRG